VLVNDHLPQSGGEGCPLERDHQSLPDLLLEGKGEFRGKISHVGQNYTGKSEDLVLV